MELIAGICAIVIVSIIGLLLLVWGIIALAHETIDNGWGTFKWIMGVLLLGTGIILTKGILFLVFLGGAFIWHIFKELKKYMGSRSRRIKTSKEEVEYLLKKAYNTEKLISRSRISFVTAEEVFDLCLYGFSTGRIQYKELLRIQNLLREFQHGYILENSDLPNDKFYKTFAEQEFGITKTEKLINQEFGSNNKKA